MDEEFRSAANRVSSGALQDLSDSDKLRLYGLYNVALKGAPTELPPSSFNIREAAKFAAWVDASHLSTEQAKSEYIKLTERLSKVKNSHANNIFEKRAPTGFQIGQSTNTPPKLDLCHWASIGDVPSVRYCIERRKDSPDYRDEDGLTPLMRAADRGHLDVVDALLDYGANLQLTDEDGNTALHYAAICGHAIIAGVLVLAHANVDAKDNDGATPFEVASDAQTKSIITSAKARTWLRPPRPATIVLRRRLGYVAGAAFFMLLLSVVFAAWRRN